jgi:hypothetical protein
MAEELDDWKRTPEGDILVSLALNFKVRPTPDGEVAVQISHTPTTTLHRAVLDGTAKPEVLQIMIGNTAALALAKAIEKVARSKRN